MTIAARELALGEVASQSGVAVPSTASATSVPSTLMDTEPNADWPNQPLHSWLNRFRHLLIRWAKKPENYLAMLHFACARITWYNCLFG